MFYIHLMEAMIMLKTKLYRFMDYILFICELWAEICWYSLSQYGASISIMQFTIRIIKICSEWKVAKYTRLYAKLLYWYIYIYTVQWKVSNVEQLCIYWLYQGSATCGPDPARVIILSGPWLHSVVDLWSLRCLEIPSFCTSVFERKNFTLWEGSTPPTPTPIWPI